MDQGAATVEPNARDNSGGEALVALEGVARRYRMGETHRHRARERDSDGRARRVHRRPRSLGQRQDDPAQHHRRARLADRGDGADRRSRAHPGIAARAVRVSPPHGQLHLPDLQPVPGADGVRERRVRRRRQRPRRRSRARARDARSGRALEIAPDHFPHELSGGEQQRVAIARALATRNPILLADEPTGELDFRTGVQILELLHEQTHEQETAVLVVTHNREIARVAHRVIELSSGRIVSDAPALGGPADDLRPALVADARGCASGFAGRPATCAAAGSWSSRSRS